VDQLANDAGVNKRMIYHYFGNKEGLCAWALDSQVARLENYASEHQHHPREDDDTLDKPLVSALRSLLAPSLPEKLPEPLPNLSDAAPASFAVDERNLAATYGVQRAAIIVLRALLDLRGAQPNYQLAPSEETAWRQVTLWLTVLATSEGLSGAPSALVPPAKQRLSLSPVISPISDH
jgi:AcrR family transcriptional regulator